MHAMIGAATLLLSLIESVAAHGGPLHVLLWLTW